MPIYANFEGKRVPKKTHFFVKIFQKVPKKVPKHSLFSDLGELGKSISSILKKRSSQFLIFFKKKSVSLEKILNPPLGGEIVK